MNTMRHSNQLAGMCDLREYIEIEVIKKKT